MKSNSIFVCKVKDMKAILGITVLAFLAACGTTKIKGDGEGQVIESKKEEKEVKAKIGYSFVPKDSVQSTSIDTVFIEGNTLTLKVHYGGGCEEHFFALEGSASISKSLPPIRNIRLSHQSKLDVCKAIVYKTLRYDISEYAYKKEAGSEIFLTLEGYNERLKYTYVAQK